MIHHRQNTRPRKERPGPVERVATRSNQVWCWDITWLPTIVKGMFYYGYMIIDIFDKSIVGWSIHAEESETHSRDLFERLLRGRNIRFEYLHSDNGSPMKGSTLTSFLQDMHVGVSYNRPGVSNDNPFIESFFSTMKYSRQYPLKFRDISHAREWMAEFVQWYNTEHRHSSIDYVTPQEMRNGSAGEIFRKRNEVLSSAKAENPEIWGSRETKKWGAPARVYLNGKKESQKNKKSDIYIET